MSAKINHPFKAPDRFFDDFRIEIEEQISNIPSGKPVLRLKIRNYLQYAAIAILFFGIGYTAFWITHMSRNHSSFKDYLTIEEIYPIIPEDEMTEFVIENLSAEKLEQIKF